MARTTAARWGLALGGVAACLIGASALGQGEQPRGTGGQPAATPPAAPAPAQPSADLPSPESLFEKHIEAIGGLAALQKHTNRVAEGVVSNKTAKYTGRISVRQSPPDKILLTTEQPGGRTQDIGYDGEVGWLTIRGEGSLLLADAALRDLQDSALFNGDADYNTLYQSMKTIGRAKVEDKVAYAVQVKTIRGKDMVILFDEKSGLILRKLMEITTSGAKAQFAIVLEEYTDIEGVKYPMMVRQQQPDQETVIRYRSIKVNVPDFVPIERGSEIDELIEKAKAEGKTPAGAPG